MSSKSNFRKIKSTKGLEFIVSMLGSPEINFKTRPIALRTFNPPTEPNIQFENENSKIVKLHWKASLGEKTDKPELVIGI